MSVTRQSMSEADDKSVVDIETSQGFIDNRVRDFVFSESKRFYSKREWFLSKDGRSLCSSDFSTDVVLEISGDFATEAERLVYSYWLMRVINAGENVVLLAEQMAGLMKNNEVSNGKNP